MRPFRKRSDTFLRFPLSMFFPDAVSSVSPEGWHLVAVQDACAAPRRWRYRARSVRCRIRGVYGAGPREVSDVAVDLDRVVGSGGVPGTIRRMSLAHCQAWRE